MILEPVTVEMDNFIGSPSRFKRFAAGSVIKLQVAQLSKRQLIVPSVVDNVCMDRRTSLVSATEWLLHCVASTLAMKGVVPP
jgi:hypothetical protein